jgi:hypothetical protein
MKRAAPIFVNLLVSEARLAVEREKNTAIPVLLAERRAYVYFVSPWQTVLTR